MSAIVRGNGLDDGLERLKAKKALLEGRGKKAFLGYTKKNRVGEKTGLKKIVFTQKNDVKTCCVHKSCKNCAWHINKRRRETTNFWREKKYHQQQISMIASTTMVAIVHKHEPISTPSHFSTTHPLSSGWRHHILEGNLLALAHSPLKELCTRRNENFSVVPPCTLR
eukprot:TRINITY_DN680_c0_g1_i1.p1 TRINITY_DN680_c0_g1~~TRINITY_DN680_c0_g1_i1.p1  ORF type:complete len:175 (+),score=19.07 TRINITY_DN680_c0_g1_i1:25-525(+)